MNESFFKHLDERKRSHRRWWHYVALSWFGLMSGSLLAQIPTQVVTKVITKELPYTDGQRIRLNAQKADVVIKGWNRPVIAVTLRLIAKNTDRTVAEREVNYHQYVLQTSNGQVDLSNQFVIPHRAGKLQSQLRVVYEISLPTKAVLSVNNSFGDLKLSDLDGDVTIKFEFGKLLLDDIGGKLTITSDYGDIDGRNLDATLVCKAEKADVVLRGLSGRVSLQSHYGKLTLIPAPSLTGLKVEAARTEILVAARHLADFSFDVITSFADIRVPESTAGLVGRYGSKQTFQYQPPGKKPEIAIQNSYSNVVIQGEKPLVDR